jgi:multidrug resistance efflux pump
VARLRVPDLESRIAQKRADIAEAEAKVRLLRSSARKDISGNETVGPTVRLEEVNAAQAHVARLQEELKYLDSLTEKLVISSAIGGFVTTPRLKEKIGSYLHDGDLICTIEQADDLTAEIALNEQDVGDVQPGQPIELTARALPFETLFSKVDRIAPAATSGKLENTVTVYCNLNSPDHTLRPGMTGHARIACGRKPAGILITNEIYRRLRTEFWW